MTDVPKHYDLRWTRGHLQALVVLLVLGAIALVAGSRGRVWFRDDAPVDSVKRQAVAERIDPNTASAASLCRLPGIGPTRAQAILQYRQDHPPAPFRTAGDLQLVPDLGPGITRAVAPYLTLPDDVNSSSREKGEKRPAGPL